MRQWIDQLRKKSADPIAVLLANCSDDKVTLIAGISNSLVERGFSAGKWITPVAETVGGGGGGNGNGNGKPPKAGNGGNPKPDKAFVDQIAALRREVLALQSGGKDGGGKKKGVCFNMRDHGSCKEGKNCKWSHDQAEVQAARKALKADQVNLGTGAAAKARLRQRPRLRQKEEVREVAEATGSPILKRLVRSSLRVTARRVLAVIWLTPQGLVTLP
jgi:hypothetical protein